MANQIKYDDVATVGELLSICEEIVSEHGDEVEVMTQCEDGPCAVVSPLFTEPEDWDPYDDGTLTL